MTDPIATIQFVLVIAGIIGLGYKAAKVEANIYQKVAELELEITRQLAGEKEALINEIEIIEESVRKLDATIEIFKQKQEGDNKLQEQRHNTLSNRTQRAFEDLAARINDISTVLQKENIGNFRIRAKDKMTSPGEDWSEGK